MRSACRMFTCVLCWVGAIILVALAGALCVSRTSPPLMGDPAGVSAHQAASPTAVPADLEAELATTRTEALKTRELLRKHRAAGDKQH